MEKYSAGYVSVNPNFVIQNMGAFNDKENAIFAVMNNIFTRGFPTIPSRFLKESFGRTILLEKCKYKLNFSNVNWDDVIKGGVENNPARECYHGVLSKILGKTFIAECPLSDIVSGVAKNSPQCVDFYSPLYNAVVEIDGHQHNDNQEQNIKDIKRDETLDQNKVRVVRVPSNAILVKATRDRLFALPKNQEYERAISANDYVNVIEEQYMLAIRIHMLLLGLYRSNALNYNDKKVCFNFVVQETHINKRMIEACIIDFYMWLENIANIHNYTFTKPEFYIHVYKDCLSMSKAKGINTYISLYDVYSATNEYKNIYYVMNDYFLYNDDLVSTQSEYRYQKNYYEHISAETNYNLTVEQHTKNLLFVMQNVSDIYDEFRANQLAIIIECLNKRSVIGVLPTGAGKSLCYQISALLIPSLTIVVSPLKILMNDQYENLREKLGITNAIYLNSSTYKKLNVFEQNKSFITILSPERFFSLKFEKALANKKVGFIVIDEAHCLSEWGHDFRTSYLCLSHNMKRFFPQNAHLMALTGTASHRVFEDIDCEFSVYKGAKTKSIFADDMRRKNLNVIIRSVGHNSVSHIYNLVLDNIAGTLAGINDNKTIVFTKTVGGRYMDSACRRLVETIQQNTNFDKGRYTYFAGGNNMEDEAQIALLMDFKSAESIVKVLFVSKAFGMGVDIPDIRKTIHYGLPSSFESLYQQIGRAGRDGKQSDCYVYFQEEDEELLKKVFKEPTATIKEIEENIEWLTELRTNLYFILSTNIEESVEIKFATRLLEGIKTRIASGFTSVSLQTIVDVMVRDIRDNHLNSILLSKVGNLLASASVIVEKALYRLFLLGEINMWSVVYDANISNPTYAKLSLTNLSETGKLKRLGNHIEKYETYFRFSEEYTENTFENRLRFLVKWTNENYLSERIRSLRTLYEQCVNFTNSNIFIQYISDYFSSDPIYTRLIDRYCPKNLWIEAISTNPHKTKARIARLLESYDRIMALNYVSGITRLQLGEFNHDDGKRRLILALEDMKKDSDIGGRIMLMERTYKVLKREYWNEFIDTWISVFKEDTRAIYEATKNELAESEIVVDFAEKIRQIGVEINDKL